MFFMIRPTSPCASTHRIEGYSPHNALPYGGTIHKKEKKKRFLPELFWPFGRE